MLFLFVESLVPVKCLATCVSQLSRSGHRFPLPPRPRNSMLTLRLVSGSYTDVTCSFLLASWLAHNVCRIFENIFSKQCWLRCFRKYFFDIKFTGMFSKI